MTTPAKAGMLICGNCGRRNRPETRLCVRCRFVLRGREEQVEEPTPQEAGPASKPSGKQGLLYHIRHDRRTAAYAVAVAVIVISLSGTMYYEVHKDDPSPTALLYYRYVPLAGSSEGLVQVYGNVHNWGGSGGTVFIDVQISDEAGNMSSHRLDVGKVPADGGINIDEMIAWPHPCESTLDLTMAYKVGYKSDWWF